MVNKFIYKQEKVLQRGAELPTSSALTPSMGTAPLELGSLHPAWSRACHTSHSPSRTPKGSARLNTRIFHLQVPAGWHLSESLHSSSVLSSNPPGRKEMQKRANRRKDNLTGALKGKKGSWAKFNPIISHINSKEEPEAVNPKTPSFKKFICELAGEGRRKKVTGLRVCQVTSKWARETFPC